MNQPLMPMATAVWLIDNTTLTFGQIARFCGLHELEVQGIADGTVGPHIVGVDPTAHGQLTWDEIKRCQDDPDTDLQLASEAKPMNTRTKGPRYTPVSKRQDKPDAIAWLIRYHPELSDTQISRLVGTTKTTIQSIRTRSHWNMSNIRAQDPVALGLCRQLELDEAVQQASERAARAKAASEKTPESDVAQADSGDRSGS